MEIPNEPESGAPWSPDWGRKVVRVLRSFRPKASTEIMPNVGTGGTTFALRARAARAGAAAQEIQYGLQVYRSIYTGEGDPPDDQALRFRVRPGWIGQLRPTNITNEFVVSDDAVTIVYYAVTTDAGTAGDLVSVEIMTGDSLPTDPAGTDDHAPAVTYGPLATITAAGGKITEILNDAFGSRSVKAVLTEVTCGHFTLGYLHAPASLGPDASSEAFALLQDRVAALEEA